MWSMRRSRWGRSETFSRFADSLQARAQAVIAALRTLPDDQREVIVLYYYQSLEGAEIAAALGIPFGTVRSRLAAGVRHLREWMEEKAL